MLDQRAWDQIADALDTSDFYRADHRLIFGAIATLIERDLPPDAVTVSEVLSRQGELDAAGGTTWRSWSRTRPARRTFAPTPGSSASGPCCGS